MRPRDKLDTHTSSVTHTHYTRSTQQLTWKAGGFPKKLIASTAQALSFPALSAPLDVHRSGSCGDVTTSLPHTRTVLGAAGV